MQTSSRKFSDFPRAFRGSVLRPGEPGFAESRRIFNMKRAQDTPALIARVADADDVACAMRYAQDRAVPVAIRSGGHSSDGSSMPDGALVLDMTSLKGLSVDAARGICRAESGVLLGELDVATQQHGLVVPAGTVSSTGIAGLTLGGGVGFNMRRFGATVDSLLGCDLVTADGRKVRASQEENPDLFWALRGGGGNFGVVTAFEFKAHQVGTEVLSGVIVFPAEQAGDVLAGLREHMVTAPRELAMIAAATACPPFPPISPQVHGKPVLMLIVVYTGPASRRLAVVEGLGRLGQSVATLVGPTPWVATNRMLDVVAPYGRRLQTRGGYLTKMSDRVIGATVKNLLDAPPPTAPLPSTVQNLWCMGGAISEDFDEDSTAFSREGATWFWESIGQWDGPEHDAAYLAWTDRTLADVSRDMRANGYVNLTEDLGPTWLRGLYGSEDKYRRLVDAKTRWDPLNLLRFNKNFSPRGGADD